jgi:hypothetical protein
MPRGAEALSDDNGENVQQRKVLANSDEDDDSTLAVDLDKLQASSTLSNLAALENDMTPKVK